MEEDKALCMFVRPQGYTMRFSEKHSAGFL